MALTSAIGIYFIIWWLTLFVVLPWGIQTPHDTGDKVEAGHAPSAPIKPQLRKKFIITTILSAVIFTLGMWIVKSGLVTLDNIPFMPEFRSYE